MGVDSSSRSAFSKKHIFLKNLIKKYIGKKLAQNRTQRLTQIQQGYV